MKKIIMYNPSISTMNLGDTIIYDSIKMQLFGLLKDAFKVDFCTHTPMSRSFLNCVKGADYKFVCGSNLLMGKLNHRFRQWDINLLNASLIGPAILIGVGWWQYNNLPNLYTKVVYKKVLSTEYLHSVRDEYTKIMMESMGFKNVINTSCPSVWGLTESHCRNIPQKKANDVVFTISDYKKDIVHDNKMIEIISKNYEQMYVWLQGWGDAQYLSQLSLPEKLIVIPPDLEAYNKLLNQDIDYIGTRLHAGIRALQKGKRSIIISIDNRAGEMRKDIHINCMPRNRIEELDPMINSTFPTDIKIPLDNINKWKSQF